MWRRLSLTLPSLRVLALKLPQNGRHSRFQIGPFGRRPFSTSDNEKARSFIVECGYSPEIAEGVVKALSNPTSGIPPGMVFAIVKSMAGRWEVGEDAGLVALCKSVEQELALTAGKKLIKFSVSTAQLIEPIACEGLEGWTLKDVAEHGTDPGAKLLAEHLECACSGVMACSTCQVYVHPDWFSNVGSPCDAELDMIECAHEPQDTSRLGCQIVLKPDLDGMKLTLPGGSNNMFDFIPFD